MYNFLRHILWRIIGCLRPTNTPLKHLRVWKWFLKLFTGMPLPHRQDINCSRGPHDFAGKIQYAEEGGVAPPLHHIIINDRVINNSTGSLSHWYVVRQRTCWDPGFIFETKKLDHGLQAGNQFRHVINTVYNHQLMSWLLDCVFISILSALSSLPTAENCARKRPTLYSRHTLIIVYVRAFPFTYSHIHIRLLTII